MRPRLTRPIAEIRSLRNAQEARPYALCALSRTSGFPFSRESRESGNEIPACAEMTRGDRRIAGCGRKVSEAM